MGSKYAMNWFKYNNFSILDYLKNELYYNKQLILLAINKNNDLNKRYEYADSYI